MQVCRDGAWVENKGPLLTFHYRDTPTGVRHDLLEKARAIIESFGFNASDAQCAIEAKPPVAWNKGRASIYILRTAFGVDWSERIKIIYAGDDATDEDAMLVCIYTEIRLMYTHEKNLMNFFVTYQNKIYSKGFERYGCHIPCDIFTYC